jgi:hypothetical protein
MIDQISETIEEWLMTAPIQITNGKFRGGVIGWLSSDENEKSFVYPEITGYFLSALAFIVKTQPKKRVQASYRANSILNWLENIQFNEQFPDTRCYVKNRQSDWYNRAYFSFDIGTLIRGLDAAAMTALIDPHRCQATAQYLLKTFERMCDNIPLSSHMLKTEREIPKKWSTIPGIHHVKTCAALSNMNLIKTSTAMQNCLNATIIHWQKTVLYGGITSDLHQVFYYLEGLFFRAITNEKDKCMKEIAIHFKTIMQYQYGDGSLPSNISDQQLQPAKEIRADVQAQALRTGAVLCAYEFLSYSQWGEHLEGLYLALCRHITKDGAVMFQPLGTEKCKHQNTWCGIFAHQALLFYSLLLKKRSVPYSLSSVLI